MVQEQALSTVLSNFARTLVTDFPIQGILDRLVHEIVAMMPISAAGVTLVSPGEPPRYIAASDESAMRFEQLQTTLGQGPCIEAYECGQAVAVPDLAVDTRFPRFAPAAVQNGLRAVFTFPLRHGHSQLGALDLYRNHAGALGSRDMDAAQTLADVTSAYLINAEARQMARRTSDEYRHTATHDPLTGLPNRLVLEERFAHAAQRAQRSRSKAAILFVDLDDFKRVNDTFGHRTGDELLVAVARRLSALLRPGDTLVRLSGDEFVIVCEDLADAGDVEMLATRISRAFGEPFRLSGAEKLVMTASVGMAFAGPGVEIAEEILARADAAMYEAKRGRVAGQVRGNVIDLRPEMQRAGGPIDAEDV